MNWQIRKRYAYLECFVVLIVVAVIGTHLTWWRYALLGICIAVYGILEVKEDRAVRRAREDGDAVRLEQAKSSINNLYISKAAVQAALKDVSDSISYSSIRKELGLE